MRTKGKDGKKRSRKAPKPPVKKGLRYIPSKRSRRYSSTGNPLSEEEFRHILKHGEVPPFNMESFTRELGRKLRLQLKHGGKSSITGLDFWYTQAHRRNDKSTTLWHGTPIDSLKGVLSHGLLASYHGMLGPGVYLGSLDKARGYTGRTKGMGLLLKCRADLGRVHRVESYVARCWADSDADTLTISQGTFTGWSHLRNPEWCIRDPDRVEIVEVHLTRSRDW